MCTPDEEGGALLGPQWEGATPTPTSRRPAQGQGGMAFANNRLVETFREGTFAQTGTSWYLVPPLRSTQPTLRPCPSSSLACSDLVNHQSKVSGQNGKITLSDRRAGAVRVTPKGTKNRTVIKPFLTVGG